MKYRIFLLILSISLNGFSQKKPTDFDKKIKSHLSNYQKIYNTFTNSAASEKAKKNAYLAFKKMFKSTGSFVWNDLDKNLDRVDFIKVGQYFKTINESYPLGHKMKFSLSNAKIGEIIKNYNQNSRTCEVKIKKTISYPEIIVIQDSLRIDSISSDTTFFTHKDTVLQKKTIAQSFYFMFDIEKEQLIKPQVYAISKVGVKPKLKPLKGNDKWWVGLPKDWKIYFVTKLKMPEFPDKYDFAKLDFLTKIDLTKEKMTDLTPLQKVTGLKILRLQNTQVSDLSPIKNIKGLVELNISNTQITDLSVLEGLTDLKILKCNKLNLTNLDGIKNMTNLIELECKQNKIEDIEPLKNFMLLEKLDMSLNLEITTIEPLRGLENLTDLIFIKMKVKDLSPISNCKNLVKLNCFNNQIESITPIRSCFKLTNLNIGYNKIYSLDPLAGMRYLIELHLKGAPVEDISVIRNYENIQVLDFSETHITDLGPIMNCKEILTLRCIDSRVPKGDIARFKKKYPKCRIYYF